MSELEPSLRNLAHLLRSPELWPSGYEFNFGDASTCAMGLASLVWGLDDDYPSSCAVARRLGISADLAQELFVLGAWMGEEGDISAEMIADRIDEVLDV